jgi:3-oxoacyl-[acyl-carrier protein] reductase
VSGLQEGQRVALVTGASRGIGRAILERLAQDGYFVVGTATTDGGAQAIRQRMEEQGINGLAYALRVESKESVAELLDNLKRDADLPLVLVNNAGITRDNLLLRMQDDEWDSVIETNLNSLFRLTKPLLRGMTKARWGRIINLSSVVGRMGNPGQSNYAASKGRDGRFYPGVGSGSGFAVYYR